MQSQPRPLAEASRPGAWLVLTVSMVGFLVVLLRTAWVCDDAFITYRTVDNFVNGHGLRWNVAERVQAFTHPLWMLLFTLLYSITREPYFTSIALSVGVSLAALVVYGRLVATGPAAFAAGAALLLCSKAFVDYSTSGLENPLTHLLLFTFLAAWPRRAESRRWQLTLWLALGLALSNRHDLATLLVVPAAAELWRAHDRRSLALVVLGLTPFIAWELFSLVYYGFALPNTAYAKLNTGIAQAALWQQGVSYYLDSLARDPVTLAGIATGVVIGTRDRRLRPVALGIVAYTLYVLSIGGDNMSGRFLTAPFAMAVGILGRQRWPVPVATAGLAAATAAGWMVVTSEMPPFATGGSFGVDEPIEKKVDMKTGIDDERRYYYPDTGLLRVATNGAPFTHEWVRQGDALRRAGRHVTVSGFIGFLGFYAGPDVHIIDCHALSDPLLARLPADPHWRTGHYVRRLPAGYVAAQSADRHAMSEADMRAYYGQLEEVVSGDLLSPTRLAAIVAVNLDEGPRSYASEPSTCDDISAFYRDVLWK